MKSTLGFLGKATFAACAFLLSFTVPLEAAWTTFNLPPLGQSFGSYWMEHLSDGRLVYGSTNDLDLETAFGSGTLVDYSNALAWDPSGLTLRHDNLAAVGQGTFGNSGIYLFDPSNPGTGFTAIAGVSIQNYSLLFRDGSSLYVGGLNGTETNAFSLPKHAISYVTLDGSVNKVIIDNVSEFSGNFAVDLTGNLYVTNNDNGGLYKFSAAQLDAAISGSALSISAGQFLTTLPANSSIAIDSQGRILSAGFGVNGFDLYDPADDTHTNIVPALSNPNYVVTTFSDGTDDYIAYLNAAGSSAGSAITYGYDKVSNVVPEPSSMLLLVLSVAGFASCRRRS